MPENFRENSIHRRDDTIGDLIVAQARDRRFIKNIFFEFCATGKCCYTDENKNQLYNFLFHVRNFKMKSLIQK